MPGASKAKNWCFTLNNYTDADCDRITGLEASGVVSYCVFGREVGDSGTPHLQGFIQFKEKKTRAAAIALVGQAHFTVARQVAESIAYCKKDGEFTEFGSPPTVSERQRTDLDAFKEEVKSGVLDEETLRENHSDVWAKYPRFCLAYIEDNKPKPPVVDHPLKDWQQDLYDKLEGDPDPRKIIFLVDYIGNTGKSWFAHWYCRKHVRPAQVLLPGKKADMAYALNNAVSVLFIDAPRSKQGEYLQYDFLEEIKNGYVFSTKYESRMKLLGPCHVVVSMNEQPDLTKLSEDRYEIINL